MRSTDALTVAESTWHRWLAQYGGMKASDAKRLKELEAQNARLKKLVANQALDIDVLVVAKGDRLVRSLMTLSRLLEDSDKRGWSLVALDLDVDTCRPPSDSDARCCY